MVRRSALALLVVALVCSHVGRAAAQDVACVDRLSDAEVSYRLAFLERRFEEGKRPIRAWWWSFLAFGVVTTTLSWTQFARAPHEEDPQTHEVDHRDALKRHSRFITAVGASFILAQLSVAAPPAAFAPQRLRRLPSSSPEERRAKLVEAQRLLERSAARERSITRGFTHAGPGAWSLSMGTYLAVRFGDVGARAVWPILFAYGSPLVATEVRVFLQPRQAFFDWERYRGFACTGRYTPNPDEENGELEPSTALVPTRAPAVPSVAVRPLVGPLSVGLHVAF